MTETVDAAEVRAGARSGAADARFRALFEQSPLSVQVLAPTGETIAVNRAWEDLWGVTLADLPGYNVLEDPQLAANGVLPLLRRALAGERVAMPPVSFVPDRGRYAGRPRWARAVASPVLDECGRVAEVMLVHEDVTEAVETRDRLARTQDLLEESQRSALVGSWEWDVRAGALTLTEELRRICGLAPDAGPLGGDRVLSLVHPDDREPLRAAVERAVREDRPFALDHRIVRADGADRVLHVRGRVIFDETGAPTRLLGSAQDVTERRRTAERLARLAAIVESSEDAIVGRTLDGTITDWNRGAERLYGYTADEAVGRHVSFLVPPECLPELDDLTVRLGRGERIAAFETVRLHKDGTPLDVAISLSPIADGFGRVVGASVVARDVTERKRTEASRQFLAEAGAVLATTLDPEATARAVADLAVPRLADGCVVHLADEGVLRRVAMTHADPARASLAEALPARYPTDAPSGPARVVRTGEAQLVAEVTDDQIAAHPRDADHLRLMRSAGVRGFLTVPLRARGRVLGTVTLMSGETRRRLAAADLRLAQDLADRVALAIDNARLYREAQAAEARYRGLFAGVADTILVADAARRYVDANPAATELLGYDREELLGLRVEDVVTDAPEWTADEYARYQAEGSWRGELELRRKDGTSVPVEALATIVDLPGGPVYLSAVRDVSDRKRAERLQRDFLAMVGHDLRGPLTTLRGNAQLLRRRGAYREANVDAIITQADRMARLIDDLTDLVRFEAGRPELRRAPVELVGLVRAQAEAARVLSADHAVEVVAPDGPLTGEWDADRLGQVLQNLLGNALKHAPAGGRVEVRVETDGAEARVSVRDEGPGIAPEHLPHLFERFYRADATGAGGLGLGLYISRMLVEAHGGRIWAESEPGAGSTFTVALPVAPEGSTATDATGNPQGTGGDA